MPDKPIDLDERRGMNGRTEAETRRQKHDVRASQESFRLRQEEFEHYLTAAPAVTFAEAAEKARYLIKLYAATPDSQDPRRKKLIAMTLDELARLSD